MAEEAEDWRDNHRSQLSKLQYIIDNDIQDYGDVTIIVGAEKKSFRIISAFIEINSKFLADKLAVEDELYLPDEDPTHFRMLLRVMYLGKWEANLKEAIPLLAIAEKYEADLVEQECKHWLMHEGLSVETSVDLYQEAKELNVTVAEDIWKYILENGMAICQSSTFLNLTQENLIQLAQDDDLRIDDETVMVEAVKKWGNRQRKIISSSKKLSEVVAEVVPKLRLYFISPDSAIILLNQEQSTQLQACRNPDVRKEVLESPSDACFCVRPRKFFTRFE
ncbi:unnamed protein product [Allacma fusca]|uniref:BTB domain-containing protein n=1 Tax=Allacma fusca TaxID=39272 RepID=A0A8J2J7A3_9HEXA|nr:unnamed protein product [Allacma fusca]